MDNLVEIKSSEVFSFRQFSIIFTIHLLSIGAFFTYTPLNFKIWIFSHYFFGTIGASIGLHRFFSHKSFETKPIIENFIGVIATLCFQGGPIFWASGHRVHHKLSEKPGDPYDASRGFYWSHIKWLFYKNPNGFDYIKNIKTVSDLRKNKFFVYLENKSTIINFSFLVILFSYSVLIKNLGLFFYLGPLRIVTVWHATWLINSYAHKATFLKKKLIKSYRNSIFMSLIIGGDGNHEYHHNNPSSVKHATGLFHLDHGYYLLKLFSLTGLVKLRDFEKTHPRANDLDHTA